MLRAYGMKITPSDHNGITIFRIEGRLDATTAPQLDQEFGRIFAEGARRFAWDCSQLTYISSAGLRSVLQALKQSNAKGGKLVLHSVTTQVMEVFEISGFKSLLTICPDRATAEASLAA